MKERIARVPPSASLFFLWGGRHPLLQRPRTPQGTPAAISWSTQFQPIQSSVHGGHRRKGQHQEGHRRLS